MTDAGAVRALEHVLVLCGDLERSGSFYERALGLRIGPRPPLQFEVFVQTTEGDR